MYNNFHSLSECTCRKRDDFGKENIGRQAASVLTEQQYHYTENDQGVGKQ